MFEKILLPLDGSEIAETALTYGEELARYLGSELVLLHVRGQEHGQEYEHIHQIYLERLAETVELHLRNGQPGVPEVKVTIKVEAGEPIEHICSLVEKNDIKLVIMAATSASSLRIGKMLGSVSDQVCRTVPVPVLLLRPQRIKSNETEKRLINHILLPLDGSELSKLALPLAEGLADKLKLPITLFQMANEIRPYYDGSMSGGYGIDINYYQMNEEVKKLVGNEMLALEKDLAKKGLNVTNVVTSGLDAADEIIEIGKKVGADLIIMSTHGRSGLGRFFYGNVAEKILRHGETPVLFVHARGV